ncbi:MAG TPA: PhnD/SsuA/transferrin family substrate-binding protein [Planctomycetia bacterium]|nr:PhnD/SsuA/transferrin family substrate-binding protein [Planctomycetia bacterium]
MPPEAPAGPLRVFVNLTWPLLLAAGLAVYFDWTNIGRPRRDLPYDRLTTQIAVETPAALERELRDLDGDLVADPPADPVATLDPAVLRLAVWRPTSATGELAPWRPLLEHLEKSIGRKVEAIALAPQDRWISVLARGEAQAACLPGERVPAAVRAAGFVPLGTIAVGEATGVQALLVAPSRTSGEGPEILSGRRVAFTAVGDFAGFLAPVAAMRDRHRLALGRNYAYCFAGGPQEALAAVAARERDPRFEQGAAGAAIDSDDLERGVETGVIARSESRALWRSPSYPALVFGRSHRLAPALAVKLAAGLASFAWKNDRLGKELRPGAGDRRYVAIDYRRDFAFYFEVESILARIRAEPPPAIPY